MRGGRVRATKTTKLPDPPLFTDSVDPTFDSQYLLIKAKFRSNLDYFKDENAKMDYVYGRTSSDA